MTTEQLVDRITNLEDQLTDDDRLQVAEFIAFLKFRHQRSQRVILDPAQLAEGFATFADDDRAFAEAGMNDYAALLHQED